MAYQASLDGTSLPVQFDYPAASPVKRSNTKRTVNAVVVQTASEIVDGDTLIAWTCPSCCFAEWKFFLDKFNQNSNPNMPFTGYHGDVMTVKFHNLDPAEKNGRLYNVSGSFQVMSVTAWSA